MRYTDAEWAQLETESLLRYLVAKLRAQSGALLYPRPHAPLLLLARTEFWPHTGFELAETAWDYSRRRLLAGEPAQRGPLTLLPLFETGAPQLRALLALTDYKPGTAAVPSQSLFFDLLARQVTLPSGDAPRLDERVALAVDRWPAGARTQIQEAMRERIEDALARCRGNVRHTARRLDMPCRTLWGQIARLEIDVARFRLRSA